MGRDWSQMPLRILCLHISDGGYGSELSFQKQACYVEAQTQCLVLLNPPTTQRNTGLCF